MRTNKDELLITFFKDLRSYGASDIGQWIGAGIIEAFAVMYAMFPYQELIYKDRIMLVFSAYFTLLAAWLYLLPYTQITEDGKKKKITEKLKYMPITECDICMFRLRRLIRFQGKILPAFLAGQILFALIFFKGLVWGNLIYPVVSGFIAPVLLCGGLPMVGAGVRGYRSAR